MLRSPKLREAMDLSKESPESARALHAATPAKTRYPAGNVQHFLLARRLVEAGVPVVHFNFGYWDWHGENFVAGRQQIPHVRRGRCRPCSKTWTQRGLLRIDHRAGAGRDGPDAEVRHEARTRAATTGTTPSSCLAAGGGFTRRQHRRRHRQDGASRSSDKFYKVESFGRTLYHLLGIDPDTTVYTPQPAR